jgi:uncharacterized membrane protein
MREPPVEQTAARQAETVAAEALRSRSANLSSPNVVNALIHLYRAEMGRLTTYRVRLDTTTNWAITTSALVISFTFANPEIPHFAILLLLFLNYFFLQLEARRFRAYESSRYRIHVLERFFYPQMLGAAVRPRWTEHLIDVLQSPALTVNYLGAVGWRLRRNYLWIYAVVLLAWLAKVYIQSAPPQDAADWIDHMAFAGIPGALIAIGVAAFSAYLVAVAAFAQRIYPFGDEQSQAAMEEIGDE